MVKDLRTQRQVYVEQLNKYNKYDLSCEICNKPIKRVPNPIEGYELCIKCKMKFNLNRKSTLAEIMAAKIMGDI